MKDKLTLGVVATMAVSMAIGCASKPAAPFDAMPQAQVTAFRLQNYEPPPQAAATPAAPAGGLALPPELQQFMQAGAQQLEQIAPGLIPPGLIPGVGGAQTPVAPQTTDNAPRFPNNSQPNFRILSQAPVASTELREELAEILGDEDNFHNEHASCMYADTGLHFTTSMGAHDVLISFSCNQVQARGFAWPHSSAGMKPDTWKHLAEVLGQIFPPGS